MMSSTSPVDDAGFKNFQIHGYSFIDKDEVAKYQSGHAVWNPTLDVNEIVEQHYDRVPILRQLGKPKIDFPCLEKRFKRYTVNIKDLQANQQVLPPSPPQTEEVENNGPSKASQAWSCNWMFLVAKWVMRNEDDLLSLSSSKKGGGVRKVIPVICSEKAVRYARTREQQFGVKKFGFSIKLRHLLTSKSETPYYMWTIQEGASKFSNEKIVDGHGFEFQMFPNLYKEASLIPLSPTKNTTSDSALDQLPWLVTSTPRTPLKAFTNGSHPSLYQYGSVKDFILLTVTSFDHTPANDTEITYRFFCVGDFDGFQRKVCKNSGETKYYPVEIKSCRDSEKNFERYRLPSYLAKCHLSGLAKVFIGMRRSEDDVQPSKKTKKPVDEGICEIREYPSDSFLCTSFQKLQYPHFVLAAQAFHEYRPFLKEKKPEFMVAYQWNCIMFQTQPRQTTLYSAIMGGQQEF